MTLILSFLSGITFYLGILFFGSKRYRAFYPYPKEQQLKIRIFIPSYREDAVIIDTVKNVLQQETTYQNFEIVVIAQWLKSETINQLFLLKPGKVSVLEFNIDNSSKTKALQYALDTLDDSAQIALVLDGDNHLATDYLNHVNDIYQEGHKLIQTHRTAKNIDTDFAKVDAIAEEINNTLFRKGQQGLGLSAITIGSGMAFDYQLLKQIHPKIQAFSGWDRALEFEFLEAGYTFYYLSQAHVYDEKVQSGQKFEKQRIRWIFAQLKDITRIPHAISLLIRDGNWNYFNRAMQALIPPRLILIAIYGGTVFISMFYGFQVFFSAICLTAAYILTCYLAIPRKFRSNDFVLILMKKLPEAIIRMIKSLLKVNQAKGKFLHTEHGN